MGFFNSKRKENLLSEVSPLQQVNPQSMQMREGVLPMNVQTSVPQVSQEIGSKGQMNKSEPFFVRIDKFNEAKKNLIEIERKMRDMENVLVKLGETKQREDEEIESWKEDMKIIKGYLDEINGSVFSKL